LTMVITKFEIKMMSLVSELFCGTHIQKYNKFSIKKLKN